MKDYTIHSHFQSPPTSDENTISDFLLKKAREQAENGRVDRITDTLTGESYDFESFDRLTKSIASALHKRGFRNGDVAIYMTIFQTGVWRANGIPRASYPEDDEDTILSRVEESRCGWIYCEPEAAEMCLSVSNNVYWDVEVIVTGRVVDGCTSIYEIMDDDGSELPESLRSKEDPALILNTSGTTGKSKGAVISHEALLWTITAFVSHPFSNEHPNLLISKGTHITGCVFPLLGIVKGYHFLVMHTIKPEYMFEAIDKFKPSHIFAFPNLLVALINHPEAGNYDFSSLIVSSSGGAAVTSAIEKIILQLPCMQHVLNVYGLTEIAPVVTTINCDNDRENIKISDIPENSAGKLFTSVSAQFRDLETDEILGPNQTGVLCVKGPHLFTEYLDNPKATENAFVDGFFNTGDVGYYDENEFIFLVDRAKEIFKYFGNHVSPTEIENVINDHPAVGEVCVVGVLDPEGGGYVPRAFCVVLQDFECSPKEIEEFTNSQLPNYKHLRGGVYFVEQLPKGKTGKVTRQLVEQLEID